MAQFDNELRPIVVNGKAVLNTPDRYVSGYVVRIWSKARAADRLYHLVDGKRRPLGSFDVADMEVSNQLVSLVNTSMPTVRTADGTG